MIRIRSLSISCGVLMYCAFRRSTRAVSALTRPVVVVSGTSVLDICCLSCSEALGVRLVAPEVSQGLDTWSSTARARSINSIPSVPDTCSNRISGGLPDNSTADRTLR